MRTRTLRPGAVWLVVAGVTLLAACSTSSATSNPPTATPSYTYHSPSPQSLHQLAVDFGYDNISALPALKKFGLKRNQFSYAGEIEFGLTQVTVISLDGARLTGVNLADMQRYYQVATQYAASRQVFPVAIYGESFGSSLNPLDYQMTPSEYSGHFVLITRDPKYAAALPSELLGSSFAVTTELDTSTLSIITDQDVPQLDEEAAATEACQATLNANILARSAAQIKAAVKAAGRHIVGDLASLENLNQDVGQEAACNGLGYAQWYAKTLQLWSYHQSAMQGLFVGIQGMSWSWALPKPGYNKLPR
jgi:hypothetical protein